MFYTKRIAYLGESISFGLEQLSQNYANFEPFVQPLYTDLLNCPDKLEHPAFVNRGQESMVFSLTIDGAAYAVRFAASKDGFALPRDYQDMSFKLRLRGAVRCRGVAGTEQIVAFSEQDKITVAEFLPGKPLGWLARQDTNRISNAQLAGLIDIMLELNEREIFIDPNPDNILYDFTAGFSLLDYSLAQSPVLLGGNCYVLSFAASMLAHSGFPDVLYNANWSRQQAKNAQKLYANNLALLQRFCNVVETKLTGEELADSLYKIKRQISALQNWQAVCGSRFFNYSNL
ncbi:hypothetical protein NO1_0056 [Candidatus Termititenax aidoneus]|uniref:Uncharacterized protein n=1 Tax=Termititenax aidoneus TaxID=2218524 RepID=A0A388T850_TERA1|nr:hypothetical protein NO1_0056 [Candidatus Termititenax aidoneus]